MRIVVGMSGGVDSAVCALLLKRQGHEVLGVFMKNWDETGDDGLCTATEDWEDVQATCDVIGIPYYTVNFTREYRERVFSHFLSEYQSGRTPNPDVLCNREIKFRAFLDFAIGMGAERLATGHFARLDSSPGGVRLLRGVDLGKDQSYFLYMLTQPQLRPAMFPLGGMTKAEVRRTAAEAKLPVADKRDSTGICFIGERDFKTFLSTYLPAKPGDIVTTRGETVGRHDGLMYYTLGQRRGLGIGGRPGSGARWFVINKELDANRLIVEQGEDSPLLYAMDCEATGATWIAGEPPAASFEATAKFRYRQPDQPVHVRVDGDRLHIRAETPQRALTPGQSVVLYNGDECLGGGVIEQVGAGGQALSSGG